MNQSINNLWCIEEVARKLGLKKSTIRYLIYRKKIPHLKIGRSIRFDPEKIQVWLKQLEIRK